MHWHNFISLLPSLRFVNSCITITFYFLLFVVVLPLPLIFLFSFVSSMMYISRMPFVVYFRESLIYLNNTLYNSLIICHISNTQKKTDTDKNICRQTRDMKVLIWLNRGRCYNSYYSFAVVKRVFGIFNESKLCDVFPRLVPKTTVCFGQLKCQNSKQQVFLSDALSLMHCDGFSKM